MTRLGWILAGGIALLLAASVGLNTTATIDDGAPTDDIMGTHRIASPAAAIVAPVRADETDAAVATILERPLFARDRRPASAAVAATQAEATIPRLTGIVIGPDGGRAFFAPADGGKSTVVAVGDTLGPYKIVAIAADGVRVEGPGEPRTLVPAFGPQAAAPDLGQPTEGSPPGTPIGTPPGALTGPRPQYDLNSRAQPFLLPGSRFRPPSQYPGLPALGGPPPPPPPNGQDGLPQPSQGGQIVLPGGNAVPTAG